MIKGNPQQGKSLAKVLQEASEDSAGFEVSQDQFRSVRPSTITVHLLDRAGKVYRIDKIKPSGDHAKAEL